MNFCPCVGCQHQKNLYEIDSNYQPIDVHKHDYLHAEELEMEMHKIIADWKFRRHCTCKYCIALREVIRNMEALVLLFDHYRYCSECKCIYCSEIRIKRGETE